MAKIRVKRGEGVEGGGVGSVKPNFLFLIFLSRFFEQPPPSFAFEAGNELVEIKYELLKKICPYW